MKIFMVGDFVSDNGPANANKTIYAAMQKKEKVRISKAKNKLSRVLEVFFQMMWCEVCIICSASELNYIVLKLSKVLRKKVLIIAHGSRPLEYIINGGQENDAQYNEYINYDRTMLSEAYKVVCVSEMFCDDMKKMYPEYSDKIDFINNIVDMEVASYDMPSERKNTIISIGGGMRRKRNLVVAQAIDYLNKTEPDKYEYIVIGPELNDGAAIKEYEFVTYYEFLPHEQVLRLMGEVALYVQNSEYDTFGLAVLEAFGAGASLLISQFVGCKSLFGDLHSEDVIMNIDDVTEVAAKIKFLLQNPNNERLAKQFSAQYISEEFVAAKIGKLIREK